MHMYSTHRTHTHRHTFCLLLCSCPTSEVPNCQAMSLRLLLQHHMWRDAVDYYISVAKEVSGPGGWSWCDGVV